MTLKKNFLHTDIKSLEISRFRFVAGIIIGFLYSFVFYSFACMIREGFRLLSVTEYYDFWELTDSEVNFYNLFFAFISVIIGQSICFTFWIDRPKKIFRKVNFRRSTILNEQRVLNWYFLSWFSKLAVCLGIFFGPTLHGGYYVFSFYPDYNYIFILIIIVLFFQTWKTIRQVFKGRSIKWLLIAMIILSGISFGFSKIQLIDYKKINEGLLRKSIHYNYNLELPESDVYQKLEKRSLIENIYIITSKENPDNTKPLIVINNKEIAFTDLSKKIKELQLLKDEADVKFLTFQLHIHRDIKMNFINKTKHELSKAGIFKIAYMVTPSNPKYDKRYYQNLCFPIKLPRYNTDSTKFQEMYKKLNKFENIIDIKPLETGDYLFNDTLIRVENLKEKFKKQIIQNPDYIVKLYSNGKVVFSSYFKILSDLWMVVNELRDMYSMSEYSRKYNELRNYEEVKAVRKKYPVLIFEMRD